MTNSKNIPNPHIPIMQSLIAYIDPTQVNDFFLKMTDIINDPPFLIEYFAGIEKGDFYEEPVQGEYPDW